MRRIALACLFLLPCSAMAALGPAGSIDDANAFFNDLEKDPRSFLVVALIAVGMIARSLPWIRNDLIPALITGLGVTMSLCLFDPWSTAVLYGLIFSAIAVYSYEFVRRTFLAIENTVIMRKLKAWGVPIGETKPPFKSPTP